MTPSRVVKVFVRADPSESLAHLKLSLLEFRSMEIQSLRLFASEADLNELASRILPQRDIISDLRISLVPAGIRIGGTYQAVIRIPFETHWQISIADGKIAARLEKLKAGPLSLGLIRSYLLDAIASKMPALEIRDETLLFDLDSFLNDKGLRLRTNLTSIRCDYGALIVEAAEKPMEH